MSLTTIDEAFISEGATSGHSGVKDGATEEERRKKKKKKKESKGMVLEEEGKKRKHASPPRSALSSVSPHQPSVKTDSSAPKKSPALPHHHHEERDVHHRPKSFTVESVPASPASQAPAASSGRSASFSSASGRTSSLPESHKARELRGFGGRRLARVLISIILFFIRSFLILDIFCHFHSHSFILTLTLNLILVLFALFHFLFSSFPAAPLGLSLLKQYVNEGMDLTRRSSYSSSGESNSVFRDIGGWDGAFWLGGNVGHWDSAFMTM